MSFRAEGKEQAALEGVLGQTDLLSSGAALISPLGEVMSIDAGKK